MSSKLIELNDGLLVEVQVSEDHVQQIAGGYAEKVNKSFEQVHTVIETVLKSLTANWGRFNEQTVIDKATIELGLGFEGEGNIFVTKAKATANLTVTLEIKSKPTNQPT